MLVDQWVCKDEFDRRYDIGAHGNCVRQGLEWVHELQSCGMLDTRMRLNSSEYCPLADMYEETCCRECKIFIFS